MNKNKKWFVLPVLALAFTLSTLSTGCIIVSDDDSTLTIRNSSSFVLVDIAVAPLGSPDFGPNLLRGDVLFPGEELVVSLDCGTYDALVQDEDGATCTLGAIDLCFDDAIWVITNSQLNSCPFLPAVPRDPQLDLAKQVTKQDSAVKQDSATRQDGSSQDRAAN